MERFTYSCGTKQDCGEGQSSLAVRYVELIPHSTYNGQKLRGVRSLYSVDGLTFTQRCSEVPVLAGTEM